MRCFRTDGIIIKRKNVGESDRLITILTKKFGKIQVKAIGVRKINSRRSPHVEPLNLTAISFYKGKGIPILTEADVKNSFSKIKQDLKKVAYAYYACELIDSLCPDGQEVTRVFFLLEQVFKDISEDLNTLNFIKKFERDLLNILGYINPDVRDSRVHDLSVLVEQIIEKRLKTKQILPRLL